MPLEGSILALVVLETRFFFQPGVLNGEPPDLLKKLLKPKIDPPGRLKIDPPEARTLIRDAYEDSQVEIDILYRQGMGIRAIARETGVARNTIRALLRGLSDERYGPREEKILQVTYETDLSAPEKFR